MIVRAAGVDDLPGVQALLRQLDPAYPDVPDAAAIWQRMLDMPGMTIFVASIGSMLAATCTLNIIPHLTRGGRPFAVIENVVTDAAHRTQGLGRAVLDAACDAAWASGCYKVMLMTGSKQDATLRFYRDAGFKDDKTAFQKRQ